MMRFHLTPWVTAFALTAPVWACEVSVPAQEAGLRVPDEATAADAWQRFLTDCVDDQGLVDYRAARTHDGLATFLHALANSKPAELPTSDARKAFWINAYNALAIQGVLETYPWDDSGAAARYRVIDQPIDGHPPSKGFFQGLQFQVGGARYSLDAIEKQVLLRRWDGVDEAQQSAHERVAPDAADPRVHFALVCCARGCPRLQRWAYDAARIEAQLTEVTRGFLADDQRSRFDTSKRVWRVSELLNWYGSDFSQPAYEPRAENLPRFAAKYVSDETLARSLRTAPWRIEYLKYDWTLNIR